MNRSRVTALAASCAVSLALLEILVRLEPRLACEVRFPTVYERDQTFGYRYRAGASGRIARGCEIDNLVRINGLGFHDAERARTATRRSLRILAFGDSHTAGLHVPVPRTWTQRLEARLGRDQAEVVNLALDGTGTDVHAALLRRFGPVLRPEIVVLAFGANDVHDVRHRIRYRESLGEWVLGYEDDVQRQALLRSLAPWVSPGPIRRSLRRSALARSVARYVPSLHPVRSNFLTPSRLGIPVEPPVHSQEALAAAFESIIEFTEDAGIRLVVVPMPYRSDPDASLDQLEANVSVELRARFTLFDSSGSIRRRLSEEGKQHRDLYFRYDGHLNAFGHDVFADAVAEGLSHLEDRYRTMARRSLNR